MASVKNKTIVSKVRVMALYDVDTDFIKYNVNDSDNVTTISTYNLGNKEIKKEIDSLAVKSKCTHILSRRLTEEALPLYSKSNLIQAAMRNLQSL